LSSQISSTLADAVVWLSSFAVPSLRFKAYHFWRPKENLARSEGAVLLVRPAFLLGNDERLKPHLRLVVILVVTLLIVLIPLLALLVIVERRRRLPLLAAWLCSAVLLPVLLPIVQPCSQQLSAQ